MHCTTVYTVPGTVHGPFTKIILKHDPMVTSFYSYAFDFSLSINCDLVEDGSFRFKIIFLIHFHVLHFVA
jgi:hypothetical protein